MRITVVFVCLLSALAVADTLDFGREAIVVTVVSSPGSPPPSALDLAVRAGTVLRAASWSSDASVASYLAAHSQAERKFNRLLWTGRPDNPRYLSDGAVSTDYEFPLSGPVLSVLMPVTGNGRLLGKACCPLCGQQWPEGRPVPEGARLVPPGGSNYQYTGILVDARGTGFRPALFPRVINENGAEVIGPGFAYPAQLADWGQVALFRDRGAATMSDRIGANPLMLRALRAEGPNSSDLVISRSDAERVHESESNLRLLGECRVGLIVD